MSELSEGEKRVLKALRKLGGRAFTKKIADAADMNNQTASRYLLALEGRRIIKLDHSQPPYKYWQIRSDADAEK